MIRFQCPGCRSVLQVSEQLAGAVIGCSRCQRRFRVPAAVVKPRANPPPPPPPAPPQLNQSRERSAKAKTRSPGRPSEPPPLASCRSDRPRTRSGPRQSNVGLIVILVLGCFTALAAGIGGFWAGGMFHPAEPSAVVQENAATKKLDPREEQPGESNKDTPVPDEPKASDDDPAKGLSEVDTVARDLARRVLAAMNAQRGIAGVSELKLDVGHSRGCREHASYLASNVGVDDLDPHDQDPKRPGTTEAGKQAARSASVVRREPLEAMNALLTAPAHRALLLDDALKSVGMGFARVEGKWICVFDFLRGTPERRVAGSGLTRGYLYPVHRQANVPLAFPGNEVPDPLPLAKNRLAGYPITVTFSPRARIPSSQAWLEDESGREIPVWFSSPTQPANEKYARTQGNTLCLFARDALRPGTRYVVHVQASIGKEEWARAWSFTTIAPAEVARLRYERAVARFNEFRRIAGRQPVVLDVEKSKGCLAHAAYLARHLDHVADLDLFDEKTDLPGYSKPGQDAARGALIRLGGGSGPTDAIDWMLTSVLNRHIVLNAPVKSIALGAAQRPGGFIWVIQLARQFFKDDETRGTIYPAADQKDVPLFFGRELSSLLPGQPKNAVGGFGISANFFPRDSLTNVTAALTDGDGNELPCWLSTAEMPLPGARGFNQILLVPKKPLAPATTYTAAFRAEVAGEPWSRTWSFTTKDSKRFEDKVRVCAARSDQSLPRIGWPALGEVG